MCSAPNACSVPIDVDNMRSKAGTSATDKASFEKLIDGIQVMVAILTGSVQDGLEVSDYFKSVPCQHELGRAQENGTPVIFVLESEPYSRSRTHQALLKHKGRAS
jgi:hypothetical protein